MPFRRKSTLGDRLSWIIIGLFVAGVALIIIEFLEHTKSLPIDKGNPASKEEPERSTASPAITEPEIHDFVQQYIDSSNLDLSGHNANKLSEKLLPLLRLYAERVQYFKFGEIDKDFIRIDKIRYYQNCPRVKNVLRGKIRISPIAMSNDMEVSFYIDFQVYSLRKRKNITGLAENKLKLRKINADLAIVGETQEILYRESKDD